MERWSLGSTPLQIFRANQGLHSSKPKTLQKAMFHHVFAYVLEKICLDFFVLNLSLRDGRGRMDTRRPTTFDPKTARTQ